MADAARGENPAFLLIHGAGFGGWVWQRVIPYLEVPALAVDLPGRGEHPAPLSTVSVRACVDSILADIEAARLERILLVAHSLSGVIAAAVAARIPTRVAHLVWLAATVPPEGRSALQTLDLISRWVARRLVRRRPNGMRPPRWTVRRSLCHDMDEETARLVLDRLGPESVHLMTEGRIGVPAEVPVTYIKLLADRSLRPRAQDRMVANLPGAGIRTLTAGHMAMLTHPEELAALLNHVSREARTT